MKKEQPGFTLLEAILAIAILAVVIFALYSLFNLSLKMVWETKARVGATQLANKKIELVRNLPYGEVGTVGGVVAGSILENETVLLNEIEYNVYVNVTYVDDPFDGTYNSSPVDPLTNDYKRVLVRVSWESMFSSSPVDFYTDIAPKNGEEDLGGGTLAITVFGADGQPVEGADIYIVNNTVSPNINMHTYTNAQGQLVLPGTPEAENSYQITVTKGGYSSDRTYSASGELVTPDNPHLSVWEGRSTQRSFSVDRLAGLTLLVQDTNGLPLEGVAVNIRGLKTIGNNSEGEDVYKYDEEIVSNGAGNIILENMEWDTYSFTVSAVSGYDVAETNPVQPVYLAPGTNQTVVLTLKPSAEHSLLTVIRDVDNNTIEGASVHVTNALGYDKTLVTGVAGQAFFTPLANATTTIEVVGTGYQNYSDELIINGYTTDPIILIK